MKMLGAFLRFWPSRSHCDTDADSRWLQWCWRHAEVEVDRQPALKPTPAQERTSVFKTSLYISDNGDLTHVHLQPPVNVAPHLPRMSSVAVVGSGLARPNRPFTYSLPVLLASTLAGLYPRDPPALSAVCYATWAGLWTARRMEGDTTAALDSLIFVGILIYRSTSLLRAFFIAALERCHSALPVISSVALVAALLLSGLFGRSHTNAGHDQADNSDGEKHCKPLLFPCRTTHTRFFPKKHSFSYSYLLAGIPIGPQEHNCRYGSILSVDTNILPAHKARKGWFHIQGGDYLERGGSNLSLKEKLTSYLRSQGVSDEQWHHAYLVTAPKFLGYSFNPVSFWYIYSDTNQLVMMILEVNNTFDERRMYLLKASEDVVLSTAKFTNAWAKDFHVSPFNSRKGSYSFSAIDPFTDSNQQSPRVDNNIVLRSSEGGTKLVARIFSRGCPSDPGSLSTPDTLRFIASWWWVGFVTFPRILKEAYKLYFLRSLQVFFRPEVVPTGIGRNPNAIERALECFFQRYLCHVVENTEEPVRVSYKPAPETGQARDFLSPTARIGKPIHELEFKVTSPAFYSRFVHYTHTSEALDREGIFTDEKNRTVWISNPQALKLLPLQRAGHASSPNRSGRFPDNFGWALLRKLRYPAAAPAYPDGDDTDPRFAREDIRPKVASPLDEFVQQNCPDSWRYRQCLLKLFLAQRIAAGFTEVIDLFDVVLRLVLILYGFRATSPQFINQDQNGAGSTSIIVARMLTLVASNSVHLWSFAKEF